MVVWLVMGKIVLTGGPGAGKTSLILALEMAGERVIREAAIDIIKYEQSRGNDAPWKEMAKFQNDILRLQLQRELRVNPAERYLLDRGAIDGIAYCELAGIEATAELLDAAKKVNYFAILLIEHLGAFLPSHERRETFDEALQIERKIEEVYKRIGYDVQRIPANNIEKRRDEILRLI